MQTVKQENLDRLAETITKTLNNGQAYEAGRLYGLRWSFACRTNGGGSSELLNEPTKGALYNAMHAFLNGVREMKQGSR